MFCSNCGNQLPEGARFCSVCGTKVADIKTPIEQHIERPSYQDDAAPKKMTQPKVSFDWSDVIDESRKKDVATLRSPWDTTGIDDAEAIRTAAVMQPENNQTAAPRYSDDLVEELKKPSEDKSRTMSFIDILKQEREDKERTAAEAALPLTESVKLESDFSAFKANMPEAPAEFVELAEKEEATLEARDNSDLEAELASILGKGNAFSFADDEPEIVAEDRTVELPDNFGMSFDEQETESEAFQPYDMYDPIEDDFDDDDIASKYAISSEEIAADSVEEEIKPATSLADIEEVAPFTPISELKPGAITANIDASESEIESLKRRLADLMGENDKEPEEPAMEDIYDSIPDEAIKTSAEETKPVEPITEIEPEREPEWKPVLENFEQEPAIEDLYISEPETEPILERVAQHAAVAEPVVAPAVEAVAEPVVAPAVDAVAEPVVAPAVEAVQEPAVEPVIEPATEPVAEEPAKIEPIVAAAAGTAAAVGVAAAEPVLAKATPIDLEPVNEVEEVDIASLLDELEKQYAPKQAEAEENTTADSQATAVQEPVAEAPVAEEPVAEAPAVAEVPANDEPETIEELLASLEIIETEEEPVADDKPEAEQAIADEHVAEVEEVSTEPEIALAEDTTTETIAAAAEVVPEVVEPAVETEAEVVPEVVEAYEASPAAEEVSQPEVIEEAVIEEPVVIEEAPVVETADISETEPVAESADNAAAVETTQAVEEIAVDAEPVIESSIETDAMSIEDLEKDLFGDAFDVEEEATKKIDKFYTLYKKNEEFQKLLDEEYSKIQGDSDYEIGSSQEVAEFASQQQPIVQMSAAADTELKQAAPEQLTQKAEPKVQQTQQSQQARQIQQAQPANIEAAKPAKKEPVIDASEEQKPSKAQLKAEKKAAKAAAKAAKQAEAEDDDDDSAGNALTIIAVVIAVILVLLLAAILILNFAPTSGIGMKLDSIVENITSYFSLNETLEDKFLL